jgi:CRP-like cAMP-binding protein
MCPLDVEPGCVLSREDHPVDQFVVITRGRARATTASGGVEDLHQGAFIGENALVQGARAAATVVVDAPTTLLASTPAELRALVEVAPIVGRRLQRSHLRAVAPVSTPAPQLTATPAAAAG